MYSILFRIIDRLAALVGRLCLVRHRQGALPDSVSTVLVTKYLGAGSVIAAVPLLSAVRSRYPGAKMVLLTTSAVAQMAEILNVFGRIETISPSKPVAAFFTLLKLRKELKSTHSLVMDLELHSYFSHVLSVWLGGSYSIGLAMPKEHVYWNYACRCKNDSPLHSCHDKLAEHLDLEINLISPERKYDQLCSKRLVIAPFCSKLSLRRKWNVAKWSEFIGLFLERHSDWTVDIIGTPADRCESLQITADLPEKFRHKVCSSCGKLDLKDAFALICKAALFVSIDSAPLHFARLSGVPSVSLWGATDPDLLLRPLADYREVKIFKRHQCTPCVHRNNIPCPEGESCVRKISVSEVLEATGVLLHYNETKYTDREN